MCVCVCVRVRVRMRACTGAICRDLQAGVGGRQRWWSLGVLRAQAHLEQSRVARGSCAVTCRVRSLQCTCNAEMQLDADAAERLLLV